MKQLKTEIVIQARPEAVWAVLTDFEAFPAWNPFITSISGPQQVGGRLSVTIRPPGGQAMKFKPRVLTFDENRELRWKGQLLFPGLFDGEHYFLLQETADGQTRLTQGENFSGLLVGLFGRVLARTEQGFEAMNQALKRKCEAA